MNNALDPKTCSRCRTEITADDPNRPESLSSTVFIPENPRPFMPSGTQITWEVDADYKNGGRTCALLCAQCVVKLAHWIYLGAETVPSSSTQCAITGCNEAVDPDESLMLRDGSNYGICATHASVILRVIGEQARP